MNLLESSPNHGISARAGGQRGTEQAREGGKRSSNTHGRPHASHEAFQLARSNTHGRPNSKKGEARRPRLSFVHNQAAGTKG